MCGLCGYIVDDPVADGRGAVGRMVDSLRHRGPDDQGVLISGRVGLGFTRLAILDLTPSGRQPMTDDRGVCTIVMNGEIFNYVELRDELEAIGCRFRSRSDTEVALVAYREWGVDCFRRFRGMWAIVIHDLRTDEVVASRDPFGIKPLYFMQTGARRLFWASEIKALRALEHPLTEDERSAAAYVKYGLQDDGDWTFFREIWQLRAGEYAVITAPDRVRRVRYFDLPVESARVTLPPTERDQVEEMRRRLFEAVRISLRSDVTVWTLLSGGLDSSALVSVTRQLERGLPIHALTVVHDDPEINELEHARAVAERAHCRLEEVRIREEEWIPALERITSDQDEPTHSATTVNHWQLMRELGRRGVKVVLSGQGVDEMLYGYVQLAVGYHLVDIAASGRVHRLAREIADHWRLLRRDWGLRRGQVLAWMLKGLVSPERARRTKARGRHGPSSLLTQDGARLADERRGTGAAGAFPDRLRSGLHRMMTSEYLPWILRYEDRNSMAFSVEERVPFLDRELVPYVFALPARMKIRDGASKWVLREALRGIVPEPVRTRRSKLGFNAPERRWLTSDRFLAFAREAGLDDALRGSVVDPVAAARAAADLARGRGNSSARWRVVSYALWRRLNVV